MHHTDERRSAGIEPKERNMGFEEANRRYAELKRQRDAGTLTDEELDAQLKDLMVKDEKDRWWSKSRGTGEWYRRTVSGDWVKDAPPVDQSPQPPPPLRPPPPPPRSRLLKVGGILVVLTLLVVGGRYLYRSLVPPTLEVPDVVGDTQKEAEQTLSDAGEFEVNVKKQTSSSENAGLVVEQDPSADSNLEKGSTVTITVGTTSESANPQGSAPFEDDFSDTDSGWDKHFGRYFEGGYLVSTGDRNRVVAQSPYGTFEDALVEVDATDETIDPTGTNWWGIACRIIDLDNYYYLLIANT